MVFCNKAHGSDRNLGKDTGSLLGGKESTLAPWDTKKSDTVVLNTCIQNFVKVVLFSIDLWIIFVKRLTYRQIEQLTILGFTIIGIHFLILTQRTVILKFWKVVWIHL